jgi:hypothetical protein
MQAFSLSASPNKFMVNHFPIRMSTSWKNLPIQSDKSVSFHQKVRFVPEWLPGAGFKKVARRWAPLYGLYQDPPFDFVKDQMVRGLLCARYKHCQSQYINL